MLLTTQYSMITITGSITAGLGSASGSKQCWEGQGSIYYQVQQLHRLAPQLACCQMATINIMTDQPCHFASWEFTFPNMSWLPGCPDWGEELAFTPVLFGLDSSPQCYSGWLYHAAKSPHHN